MVGILDVVQRYVGYVTLLALTCYVTHPGSSIDGCMVPQHIEPSMLLLVLASEMQIFISIEFEELCMELLLHGFPGSVLV